MTIPSAAFTINTTAAPCAKAVAYGATVSLALSSLSGVESVAWAISGNSASTLTNPTITTSGVKGESASFTMVADPADGLGVAFCVSCTVTDSLGKTYSASGIVGVYNESGNLPLAAGETTARSATYGYLASLNLAMCAPRVVVAGSSTIDFGSISTLSDSTETLTSVGAGMLITDRVDVWCATGAGDTRFIFSGSVKNATDLYITARNGSGVTLDLASATYYYRVTR